MSTVKTNNILDASGGNTATINSMTPTADSLQGFRNRIINGDMGIDQRNAGASVTLTSGGIYTVDRWIGFENTDGAMTAQQSTAAPTGFINSLLFTTTTADGSLSSTQFSCLQQYIEGLNLTDLGWGTANAKTITISFWVRSSLTGTFGGALRNAAGDRTYPFTYTISAANTWEYETITIAGDTTGTWLTTNAIGVQVTFGLGVGTDLSGTAGSWSGNNNLSATGAVNVMGTLNATWQITGVQFEVGSVATPFERIDYGRELMLCQRYYEIVTIPSSTSLFVSYQYGSSYFNYWQFKQTKRSSPTVALGPSASWVGGTGTLLPGLEVVQIYNGSASFYIGSSSGIVGLTASSEL